MPEPDRQRVKALFHEMVGVPETERLSRLQQRCEGDLALFAKVKALLEADQEEHFLAQPAIAEGLFSQLLQQGADPVGEVGNYRIVAKIGEGGMGVVYEARQASPDRAVALKLIRAGGASPSMLQRFRREAMVLGRLEHVGIARVYEAGSAAVRYPDGAEFTLPFIAMELVRGRGLIEAARDLGRRARLRLLADVADAVQHAHQRGVIHRDLKPGNVLVGADGRPKVLDFGVASLAKTDLDGEASLFRTMPGQVVGTLAYMSPEQISGGDQDVDTRSDVYALGVIAFEVLANRLPLDLDSKSLAAAARTLQEVSPPSLAAVAPEFRGDVATIVDKALAKLPADRYASAAEFAADLRRAVADEPIVARPPSTIYLIRKFTARHQGLVASLLALLMTLVAGIVVSTRFALRAEQGRMKAQAAQGEAEIERGVALTERDKANAVTEFFRDMIAQANPEKNKGESVGVLAVLERSAAALDEDESLLDQPDIEALLRMTLGQTFADLGRLDAAQQHFARAFEIWSELHGPSHRDTIWALDRSSENYWERGMLEEAERLSRQSLDGLRQLVGEDHPDYTTGLNDHATILADLDRWDEAIEALTVCLEAHERREGPHARTTLRSLNNLATVLADAGRLEEAVRMQRRSLAARVEVYGNPSREVATATGNLGFALYKLGVEREDDALVEQGMRAFEESVRIKRQVFGPTHQDIGYSMVSMAAIEHRRGNQEAALAHAEEAIRCFEATGVDGWPLALARSNKSAVLLATDRVEEGLELAERCYEAMLRELGADHSRSVKHAGMTADALEKLGRVDEAALWRGRSAAR